MRKIKEMSDISVPDGYEKENATQMCREQYNETEKRNKLIGDVDMFEPYCEEMPSIGFVARNNVRERN